MEYKQLFSLKKTFIFFLLLGGLFLVYQTNKSNITSERKTVNTRAADSQVRVMTYNIRFSKDDIASKGSDATINELKSLANYIKNNQIDVVALQEVMKLSDEDNNGFNDLQIISDEMSRIGYPMKIEKRRTYKYDHGSARDEYFRAFLYRDNPVFSKMGYQEFGDATPGRPEGSGNDFLTLQTPLGKMIFVNHHPMPGNARVGSQKLIEYITPFKNDGAPLILMGDFNMPFYFIPPANQADYKQYVDALYTSGFKSACDPEKFPDNNCKDTVTSTASEDGYAIDQILVDIRAPFFVQKAYVDTARTDSDHMPVIAIFSSQSPVSPTRTSTPTNRPTMTPTRTPTPTTRPTIAPTRTPTPTTRFTLTPTRTPTQRPTFTSVPLAPVLNCAKRAMGDANCDGVVDTKDYACWRLRFLTGKETNNCKNTDFNGKEAVNLLDFTIWKNSFLKK